VTRRRGYRLFAGPLGWMIRGYQRANAGDLAAAVAYNALVAVVPMLLLLISAGGFALKQERVLVDAVHALVWALPQDQALEAVRAVLAARRQSPWLAAVSLVGFAWVGANFVSCLGRGMNRIYGVPNRRFVHQRARDFFLVLVFAALFLFASVAATLPALFVGRGGFNVFFENAALTSGLVQIASYGLSIVAAAVLFLVIYRVLPNAGQRLRDTWPGTLTAALLLVLLLQAFPVYIRLVGGVNRYGQFFGFIPLIVAWFYLLAHVLLFGTYVNATFQQHCRQRRGIAGHSLPGCERDAA
jgi:membrane protein